MYVLSGFFAMTFGSTTVFQNCTLFCTVFAVLSAVAICLQCFDAVGCAGRKAIQPVKSGGVLAWLSVWIPLQTCIWPSWCHCHSLFFGSVKSRLVLPFWYWLTPGSPGQRAIKRVCVCVSSGITSHRQPRQCRRGPKTVKGPKWSELCVFLLYLPILDFVSAD